MITVGKALNEARIAEECFPALTVIASELGGVLQNGPELDTKSRKIGGSPFHDFHMTERREFFHHK